MLITTETVKDYLKEYQLVTHPDDPDKIVCTVASQILYTCFLKRFHWDMEPEQGQILAIYQDRVADLLEDLRERTREEIVCVLEFLDGHDRHLLDVVIMAWCHPRPRQYMSKTIYQRRHRELISRHQKTMINLEDHYTLRNFRAESLTRDCHLPTECIDYLWLDLSEYELIPVFSNEASAGYIKIVVTPTDDGGQVELTFNMKYILEMGIGAHSISYRGTPRSFQDVIQALLTDPSLVKAALDSDTGDNYLSQFNGLGERATRDSF